MVKLLRRDATAIIVPITDVHITVGITNARAGASRLAYVTRRLQNCWSRWEFRNRLNGRQAIGESLQKMWKSHRIPISTYIPLLKALVWPVATYGCQSRTLRKNEETRLDALEMTGLRKILQVS